MTSRSQTTTSHAIVPIIQALSRPEAVQPSPTSALHLAQLLAMVIGALSDESLASSRGRYPDVLTDLISHPQLLRVIRAHIRTGDPPAALPAAQLLALLLSVPPTAHTETTAIIARLHAGSLVTSVKGNAGATVPSPLLGDLWGMLRAQDPLLTPPCVACLHALSTGPCWLLASTTFVSSDEGSTGQPNSSSALLFILRKLHATAQHRGSAEAIFSCLFSTKEGARWAQRHSEAIEAAVLGSTRLEREWRTVKTL